MKLFEELTIHAQLLKNIKELNYTEMTGVQEQAIPTALLKKDLVVMAPTGTGKTAAFLIPLITHLTGNESASALILSPTRELAQQIAQLARNLLIGYKKIAPITLIGGTPVTRDLYLLRSKPRLVIATPGRLNDLIRRDSARLSKCHYLVIDEADRMFDMGFHPQVMEIVKELPKERQTLLFSATFPPELEALYMPLLNKPEMVIVGSRRAAVAETIEQEVRFVTQATKIDHVIERLTTLEGQTLVFTKTKSGADHLAYALRGKGFKAIQIHGDLNQSSRMRALKGFRKGDFKVLVATDVAARGIDVPKVELVINYDLPMTSDDYIHRVGRTGRAGEKGSALTLALLDEKRNWHFLQKRIKNLGEGEKSEIKGDIPPPPKKDHGPKRFDRRPNPRTNLSKFKNRGGAIQQV